MDKLSLEVSVLQCHFVSTNQSLEWDKSLGQCCFFVLDLWVKSCSMIVVAMAQPYFPKEEERRALSSNGLISKQTKHQQLQPIFKC